MTALAQSLNGEAGPTRRDLVNFRTEFMMIHDAITFARTEQAVDGIRIQDHDNEHKSTVCHGHRLKLHELSICSR